MQIVWFLGGFLSCAVPGLFAVLRARRIRAAAQAADPWLNPPTSKARRLLAVTREQLDVMLAAEKSPQSLTLPRGAALLPYLMPRNGVVYFHDGVGVLPYGSEVRVTGMGDAIVAALQESYTALGHAAELADRYAATLTAAERATHPNPLLKGAAGAADASGDGAEAHTLDATLGRLAALLAIDEQDPDAASISDADEGDADATSNIDAEADARPDADAGARTNPR